MAFAAWYAAAGGALEWPEEVERIRRRARARKLSLERMMKLLAKINYTLSGHTTAEHARLVLEGYAVHDWVASHGADFRDLAQTLYDQVNPPGGGEWLDGASPFSARLQELGRALQLAPLEQDILAFAFLTTASTELSGIFRQLAADRWTAGVLWTAVFATSTDELAKAMRPGSPLRLSGLLQADGRRAQFACVAPFWVDLVARADSLEEALLEPVEEKPGSGQPARLAAEDFEIATRILSNASERRGQPASLRSAQSRERPPPEGRGRRIGSICLAGASLRRRAARGVAVAGIRLRRDHGQRFAHRRARCPAGMLGSWLTSTRQLLDHPARAMARTCAGRAAQRSLQVLRFL